MVSESEQEASVSLLDGCSNTSTPVKVNKPIGLQMADESTSMLSPQDIVNPKKDDLFKIANQSVEDLLNEINQQSKGLGLSISNHSSSPLTEPLNLQNQIEKGKEINYEGKRILSVDTVRTIDSEVSESGFFDTTLRKSDSMNLTRSKQNPTGPRAITELPSKSPKKQVTIEMSPPKVMEYDVQSEEEFEDEMAETEEVEELEVTWDSVPIRGANDTDFVGRPLPHIKPSDSNFSIKSMPNLTAPNLFTSPIKENHSDSEDSEETIALSPMTQARLPTDLTKKSDQLVEDNRTSLLHQKTSTLSLSPATKLAYDHDTYLEDLRRGEVKDSKEVKASQKYRESFKSSLTSTNEDLSETEKIIEDLGGLYDSNIRNTDGDTLNLLRNDSVKSVMSIASTDRKLTTKVINKPVNNIELRAGIQGFSDKLVSEILEESDNEDDEIEDSGNEQEVEDSLNDSETADTETIIETSTTILPKANTNHQHTRSSSLSETMGNFFKNITRSISGQKLDEEGNPVVNQTGNVSMLKRSTAKRQVSLQSNATSVTNDSDFVSATEGDISDEFSFEQRPHINLANIEDSNNTIEHHDIYNASHNDTILSEEDNGSNAKVVRAEVDRIVNEIRRQESMSDIVTTASPNTENETTDRPQDQKDSKNLSSVDVDEHSTTESSDISNNSFSKQNFVLELAAFDDDPYAFDELETEDPNSSNASDSKPSKNKRIMSAELSPKNELLAIWSTQEEFKRTNHNPSLSFQSICDPTSKVIVKEGHHKSISVISHKSTSSTFNAARYSPRVESPKEIIHGFPRNISVSKNKKLSHYFSLTDERLSAAEVTFNNPMNESTVDDSRASGASGSTKTQTIVNHYDLVPSSVVENSNITEVTGVTSGVAGTSSAYQDASEVDRTARSQSVCLDTSIHLSDVLKDDGDDSNISFLEDLNKWEADLEINHTVASTTNTNNDILSNVWRRGTLSKRTVATKVENENIKFPQLSIDEMEKFMIHKRMASDEFQIKKANSKFVLEGNSSHMELQGLMMNANHESRSVLSVNDDRASAVIPELAIPTGLAVSTRSGFRIPSGMDGISDSQVFNEADAVDSVDFETENIPQLQQQPPSPSKYGVLVPQTRRDVYKDQAPVIMNHPTSPSKMNPLGISEPPRINSLSASTARKSSKVKSMLMENTHSPLKEEVKLVSGEQGRFFLRMLGLKEIGLPEITQRNAKFQVVLDNGVHCLTTDYFPLTSTSYIPINREFELIVVDGLDVVITLKLKYDKPKAKLVEVVEKKKVKSNNLVARCFGVKYILTTTKYVTKEAEFDPLSKIVATDGSFAKFHLNFNNFKNDITCQPRVFKVDGFNEWKSYKDIVSGEYMSAQPYKICAIDFNMLFIPRTSEYEILPISIRNALEQVEHVKHPLEVNHEGFMYQEGGDVEVWTRRFCKLSGYDLTAHNDTTMKVKAKINLKRVVEVIHTGKPENDDSINEEEKLDRHLSDIKFFAAPKKIGEKAKARVFSESLILNDGFKLRFSNDETVDFGCDSKEEKTQWIELLEDIVFKNNFRKQPWVKLMVEKLAAK